MTNNTIAASRLATARWEADRHAAALSTALKDWRTAPPTDHTHLEQDKGLVRLLDQILYRFTKLQDALGERLIPATLATLAEPFESWPMRDRLDRLERLGYLQVSTWLKWREVRNALAHEYPESAEIRFASILTALEAAREITDLYAQWHDKLPPA